MPHLYLTAFLTILLLPTVAMSQDIGDPCTTNQECETLLCIDEVCITRENSCTTYIDCDDESPDCPYERSVLDGTPCPGGLCLAGTCVPDFETENMDGGMPGGGSYPEYERGEPQYEGGGICSNSVAMQPIDAPVAGSVLFLILLGCVRASRRNG